MLVPIFLYIGGVLFTIMWLISSLCRKHRLILFHDNHKCPICFETMKNNRNVCVTACNHKFCLSCMLEYIKRNNTSCPICRQKIIKSKWNSHRITLDRFITILTNLEHLQEINQILNNSNLQ